MKTDRLRRVEDRLARVLAAGWRNADPDLAALLAEADGLVASGFPELASRVRRVGAAPTEGRLAAAALVLASCRMLRARVAEGSVPAGAWDTLSAGRRRASGVDRLLPLGRVALGDGEAWACLRARGFTSDWLLLEPPGRSEEPRPWLVQQLQGRLRWRARYPLGQRGDVQLVGVDDYRWLPAPEGGDDLLAPFREAAAAGKLIDEAPLLRTTPKLQARQLAGDDTASYAWPDPAIARAFRSVAGSGVVWAIAWVEGALVTPLAVVSSGFVSRAGLVHLVPGNPTDEILG